MDLDEEVYTVLSLLADFNEAKNMLELAAQKQQQYADAEAAGFPDDMMIDGYASSTVRAIALATQFRAGANRFRKMNDVQLEDYTNIPAVSPGDAETLAALRKDVEREMSRLEELFSSMT